MNAMTYTLLASAVFSLLLGLFLFWISIRGTISQFNTTNTISWLLIALFPVF